MLICNFVDFEEYSEQKMSLTFDNNLKYLSWSF